MSRIWMRNWMDPYRYGGEASFGETNPLLNAADASRDLADRYRMENNPIPIAKHWENTAQRMEHLAEADPSETVQRIGARLQQARPTARLTYQPTTVSLVGNMDDPEEPLCWQATAQVGDEAVMVAEQRAGIEEVETSRTHDGPVGAVKGYEVTHGRLPRDGVALDFGTMERFEPGEAGAEAAGHYATVKLSVLDPKQGFSAVEPRGPRQRETVDEVALQEQRAAQAAQEQMNQIQQNAAGPGMSGPGLG